MFDFIIGFVDLNVEEEMVLIVIYVGFEFFQEDLDDDEDEEDGDDDVVDDDNSIDFELVCEKFVELCV